MKIYVDLSELDVDVFLHSWATIIYFVNSFKKRSLPHSIDRSRKILISPPPSPPLPPWSSVPMFHARLSKSKVTHVRVVKICESYELYVALSPWWKSRLLFLFGFLALGAQQGRFVFLVALHFRFLHTLTLASRSLSLHVQ